MYLIVSCVIILVCFFLAQRSQTAAPENGNEQTCFVFKKYVLRESG